MSKCTNKYDTFVIKFETQKQIENEVLRIYEEEYNEIFENILIKSQSIIMDNLKKRVKSMLEDLYSPKILENEKVLIALNSIEKIIYQNYYLYDKEQLSKSLKYKGKDFIENGQNFSFLKHCIYQNNEPLHFCNQKNNFIIVLDTDFKVDLNGIKNLHRKGSSTEYNIIYAIICRNCLKSYKANYINLFCNFCSIPYYTRIISLNEIYNNSIQPATWDKYHCHLIVNQQMNCIKCKSPLFLNIKNGKLICKNCNFCDDPYNINWTCIKCGNEFNCGAKIYNPYEFKPFSNAIKKGINEKKSALPKKIPCGHDVKLIVHNKNCDGKLYLTDLNDTEMVLCSKCKSLIKYEKFIFECPKCGKRFRNKDIEDYFNKGRIINDENLDYNNKRNTLDENFKLDNQKNKNLPTKNYYSPRPSASILNNFTFFNSKFLNEVIKCRSREKLADLEKEYINKSENNYHELINIDSTKENNENEAKNQKHLNEFKNLSPMKTLNNLLSKRSTSLTQMNKVKKIKKLSKFKNIKKKEKEKEKEKDSYSSEEDSINDNISHKIIPRKESHSLDKLVQIYKTSPYNINNNDTIIQKIPSGIENNELETINLPIFDLDNFEIISQIGEGKKSKIFCVKFTNDNQFYAMKKKVLKEKKKEMNELLFSYALQYSLKNSLYFTKIFGINCSKDEFSVLEEIGVNSWNSEIATMKKMNKVYSEEDLINIIYQISICLDILEKRHLCHFNINPKNILVFKNKIYKLTDLEYVKDLNETNIIDNYNNFISPQLFSYFYGKENKKFVDLIKNDVYSLGLCIIYTMTKSNDYNNLYNNFVATTINDNDKLIDEYLKYPMSILNSENAYCNKFVYLLKKMLNRNEKERFNFNQIKNYLCKEYEFE